MRFTEKKLYFKLLFKVYRKVTVKKVKIKINPSK